MTSPTPNRLRGSLLFIGALLIFSVSDATAKYLSVYFAVPLLAWARYVSQLLFMLTTTARREGWGIVRTERPLLMVARGLSQVLTTVFVLFAFRTLPLAETTAIVFITPLLVALMASPILGEKLRRSTWLATLGGFAGVLFIARPGGVMEGIGVALALCSALCYAIYNILTRKLTATEPPARQLFYIALIGAVTMSLFLPTFWTGTVPSLGQGLMILSLGFCGGVGHSLLIRAMHHAPASSLSPLLYIQLIWSTALGWAVFGHLPDAWSVLGMAIIGVSGLILVLPRRPLAL